MMGAATVTRHAVSHNQSTCSSLRNHSSLSTPLINIGFALLCAWRSAQFICVTAWWVSMTNIFLFCFVFWWTSMLWKWNHTSKAHDPCNLHWVSEDLNKMTVTIVVSLCACVPVVFHLVSNWTSTQMIIANPVDSRWHWRSWSSRM